MSVGWCFKVTLADEKKILGLHVEQLIGAESGENGDSEGDEDDDHNQDKTKENMK